MQEEFPTRGFQSSVDYVLDFGLGHLEVIDSLRVDWPDGRVSEVTGLDPTDPRDALVLRTAVIVCRLEGD